MSELVKDAARLMDMLPDEDKNFAYEFIKKLVLAWDPDFTKVTAEEAERIAEAEQAVLWTKRISTGTIWSPLCNNFLKIITRRKTALFFILFSERKVLFAFLFAKKLQTRLAFQK